MERKIFFHPERCLACLSCMLACQMKSMGISEVRNLSREQRPRHRMSITFDRGTPWVWVCQHCLSAPCVEACVSGSLRREDGGKKIFHNSENCVGCGSCVLVCPYGALKYDEKEKRVVKCNLCLEEAVPPCVRACQTQALAYQEANSFAGEKKKKFAQDMGRDRAADR